MTHRTPAGAAFALAAALLLTACGGDSGDAGQTSAAGTTAASSCASGDLADCITDDLSVAPAVPATDAAPPTELVTTDVVVGDGPTATAGSTVEVKYVGAFYETGEEFDSSWSRSAEETLPFTVGAGEVIPGFEQGVEGMAVGGRRAITIPSELGYGEQGTGPIPGGATLVFVVDLVTVTG